MRFIKITTCILIFAFIIAPNTKAAQTPAGKIDKVKPPAFVIKTAGKKIKASAYVECSSLEKKNVKDVFHKAIYASQGKKMLNSLNEVELNKKKNERFEHILDKIDETSNLTVKSSKTG